MNTQRQRQPLAAADAQIGQNVARDDLVEAVAQRVVELLRADQPLLAADEVAKRLGRSRDWVYGNADKLGAVPLGDGERPRLGFSPAKVADYVNACKTSKRTRQASIGTPERKQRRQSRAAIGQGADLLPIRGEIPTE